MGGPSWPRPSSSRRNLTAIQDHLGAAPPLGQERRADKDRGVSKMTIWRFKHEPRFDFPPAAKINNVEFNDLDKVERLDGGAGAAMSR